MIIQFLNLEINISLSLYFHNKAFKEVVHHVEVLVKDIGDAMDGAAAGIFFNCFRQGWFL